MLDVAQHVVFTKYVDDAEKADQLRLTDAFLSRGNGKRFGVVRLEAMACGVPDIGSLLDAAVRLYGTRGWVSLSTLIIANLCMQWC